MTISVQRYSPDLAKQWVDWLVKDINVTLMQQDVDEAEQAVRLQTNETDVQSG